MERKSIDINTQRAKRVRLMGLRNGPSNIAAWVGVKGHLMNFTLWKETIFPMKRMRCGGPQPRDLAGKGLRDEVEWNGMGGLVLGPLTA